MHRLLVRQLRRHFSSEDVRGDLADFVAAIDTAYAEFDADRALLERSLDLSSRELVQTNAELRAIVGALPDLFLWLREDGTIFGYRARGPEDLAIPPKDLVGKRIQTLPSPEGRTGFDRALGEIRNGAAVSTVDYSLEVEGRRRFYEARLLPLDANRILAVIRNVSERAEAHRRLLDSEQRYRQLFEGNPQPMWVFDTESLQFLAVNEAAIRHYGFSREEFLGMSADEIRPLEDRADFREHARRRFQEGDADPSSRPHWRHCRKDGSVIDVEVVTHPLLFSGRAAVLALIQDVTRRHQLEEQLRQSQKMEAVGQLAGGVAHDFNNLLTAISGYVQLAGLRLEQDHVAQADLREAMKATERASSLTRQLLAFSRQQVLEPRVLDLNHVVTNLHKMLRRLIGEDIDLVTAPAGDLGRVRADPGQIEQVILNLAVNARDAMPKGGKLTIETGNLELGDEHANTHLGAKKGLYVLLAVSDTGCGMNEQVKSRIFEPFFTTKEQGKGTGLGLATVIGIVEQSGGHIEVLSELGRGSTFKVYLPRVDGAPAEPTILALVPTHARANETILLVEDEESVRKAVRQLLTLFGYTVIEAADADQAERCAQAEQTIDLLITDVVMPHRSGPELAECLMATRPDLRVLFVSGYTDQALIHQGLRHRGTAFLQKPFTSEVLGHKVREILDRQESEAA